MKDTETWAPLVGSLKKKSMLSALSIPVIEGVNDRKREIMPPIDSRYLMQSLIVDWYLFIYLFIFKVWRRKCDTSLGGTENNTTVKRSTWLSKGLDNIVTPLQDRTFSDKDLTVFTHHMYQQSPWATNTHTVPSIVFIACAWIGCYAAAWLYSLGVLGDV